MVITGLGLIMQSKMDKQIKKKDTDQYTSTTQAQKEETHTQVNATEHVTEPLQKQDTLNMSSEKNKADKVSKDKWHYGNEKYMDYEEPMRVREFHNNREYYDAVV